MLEYLDIVEEDGRLDTEIVDDIENMGSLFGGNDKFNVIHLNIRSLQKNFDELLIYLNLLNTQNIDVMIFSETFLLGNVENFQIKGFKIVYNESKLNRNDGLVVYIRDTFSVKTNIINLTETNILRCELKLKHNQTLGVMACYRPPSTQLNVFLNELEESLQNEQLNDWEIFVGDLNINLLNLNDEDVNRYLNILSRNGYYSCINKPTRVTNFSSTLIDHLFLKGQNVNEHKKNIKSIILQTAITDHFMIALSIQNLFLSQQKIKVPFLQTKINYNKLKNLLKEETWGDVLESNFVNIAYTLFINKIKSYIEKSTTKIKLNSKNRKRKPWVTTGIINSIKRRDNLKKELNKSFSYQKSIQYKQFRNSLTKTIRLAKNLYYKTKIEDSNGDYKKIWSFINEATNIQRHNTQQNIEILHNDTIINDDREIANIFNNFFIDIGKDIQTKITKQNYKLQNKPNISNSFYLEPLGENELIKHIGDLKNNAAPGIDNVTSEIIKNIHIYILKPLVHIINLSFTSNNLPDEWKISVVTPVFKEGKRTLPTNYRPISVISNFCKLFEKCIKQRIVNFLEKHRLLYFNQFGFRNKKSTEDAVFTFVKHIHEHFQKSKKSLAIFLDLKKAFDTVSHEILFRKLEEIGIRGGPLNLFKNYLTNRKQITKIKDSYSNYGVIKTGVPQGTVLGPILFLIYINNIGNVIQNCSVVTYADDTVLLFDGDTWEEVHKRAEEGIGLMHKWLSTNLLSLNTSKTHFMTFSATAADQPATKILTIHSNNCKKLVPSCNCVCIKNTEKIKYLGVIIDKHLKWNNHVSYLCNKIRKTFYKFNQLKEILSQKLIIVLYRSLVESILRYCIIVWGGAYDTSLNTLQICQNTILKIIFKKPRLYPTKQIYLDSNIFDLRNLYVLCSLSYMPKIQALFPFIAHNHDTRLNVNSNLTIPLLHRSVCQRFLIYNLPKMFNMLPAALKILLANEKKFKNEIKKFLLKNKYHFAKLFF